MIEVKHTRHRSALIENAKSSVRRPIISRALWSVQILLAVIFLFAGGAKLVLPSEAMQGPVTLPIIFLRLIGVCEAFGGLGLILPGLLRILPGLTPLAAAGLAIIMIGATVVNAMGGSVPLALATLVIGILALLICYGRWQVTPHGDRSSTRAAHPGSNASSIES